MSRRRTVPRLDHARAGAGVAAGDPLNSHPEIGVRNSQPEGIGRVAALGDLVAWNNLGRNVVFADAHFRPVGVFGTTAFPDDDELSQYDLDIHAILELSDVDLVVVLNHLGALRAFRASDLRRPGPTREVQPVVTAHFAEDVERTVAAGAQLIGSRPRVANAGGVLVSETILSRERLDAAVALEDRGEVTALGMCDVSVAVGGDGWVALAPLVDGKLGDPRWQVDVGFRTAWLGWDGKLVWAAGSDFVTGAFDDYRWDDLRGGGFAALDPSDGEVVVAGRLPDDVAWGNGGVAVVMVDGVLGTVGRTGSVHLLGRGDANWSRLSDPFASNSLGIAHAAVANGHILFGFNRGGYRLHTVPARTASDARRG